MSLELSGCDPLVIAKSGIPFRNSVLIYGKDTNIEMVMSDFCCLVEYALTNTDLLPDDPRLKLLEKIKQATIIDGYNQGNTRINL